MFQGPPLPLSPNIPLRELFQCAPAAGRLGVWVRPCSRTLLVHQLSPPARSWVLASPDLGSLLTRCQHIAVREGERPVVLQAVTVIQWRALQVATATPYLPGIERLRVLFPQLETTTRTLLVPLGAQSPEEVLARCLAEGIHVIGSRIVYTGQA